MPTRLVWPMNSYSVGETWGAWNASYVNVDVTTCSNAVWTSWNYAYCTGNTSATTTSVGTDIWYVWNQIMCQSEEEARAVRATAGTSRRSWTARYRSQPLPTRLSKCLSKRLTNWRRDHMTMAAIIVRRRRDR